MSLESVGVEMLELNLGVQCRGVNVGRQVQDCCSVGDRTKKKCRAQLCSSPPVLSLTRLHTHHIYYNSQSILRKTRDSA